jgi:uncharacterized membrane protein YkvA (DUF1232 family)
MRARKPSSSTARSQKKAAVIPVAKRKSETIGDEITQSVAYRKATAEAESYMNDPERLLELLIGAREKINHIPRGPFAETWPYLMAMIRVLRAYHRGEYRDVPPPNLLTILVAILYFVSPLDVIPDSVPILGQIDDAMVVRLSLESVRADLDTFMAWETSRV